MTRIVRAILDNESNVLPVSVNTRGNYGINNVCLSLPCAIGIGGVKGHIIPDITDTEKQQLQKSGAVLQEQIQKLNISQES
ncbi:MAG: hypothetical protein U5J89_09025 [Fodinibius sp.]|nr:hypothetical protein [Fodinibius sp.]MDZ7659409.1 hypothetical protein [Fodinibius sp.]